MHTMISGRYGWLVLALFLSSLSGCNGRADGLQTGHYRATLQLPGGHTPFGLDITKENDRFVMYLLNDGERTRVERVQLENNELTAVFPGYENTLRARIYPDRLEGTVTLIKAGGKEQVIPFQARLGENYRFHPETSNDTADFSGQWEVTLTDGEGKHTAAVAIFKQDHDRITGTMMTPTGDHRFLDGQVKGDQAELSTFAGGLAYLYKLNLAKSGELTGEYWQGLTSHSTVQAKRNDDIKLSNGGFDTQLKQDVPRFDFTFRDVDGKEVSLHDERFQNKVVIVTLGGSWCPNCHDEAMFLVPFYKEYRPKGVEIIALMFERHGEFDLAAKAVRGYRQDLGIEFPTLIAGVSETEEASKALPTLTGVYGYPTTLVIDKKGAVRDTHVGFTGPATGKHYDEFVTEFKGLVNQLLAEG